MSNDNSGTPESTIDQTCPYCGETLCDLWDYNWRGNQTIKTECGHCEKPIEIEAEYTVTYTISAREGK